jgi:hypothetical protein
MKRFLAGIVSLVVMCSVANATEIENLVNKLAEKGVITYGEAQQLITETNEEVRAKLAAGKVDTVPAWVQGLVIKGDLRLRHQVDWDASKNYARIRERMRLRVGFETSIVESLQAGFGFATGGETMAALAGDVYDKEPTSTNHTFGNGFGKARLMVDYAYLAYNPVGWITVTAGKMKAGTHVWNATDLMWDGDINPDGVSLKFSRNFGEIGNIFAIGSALVFSEKASTANAPACNIGQVGGSYKPLAMLSLKAAVAYEVFEVNGKNTGYYGTPTFDYVNVVPSFEATVSELPLIQSVKVFGDMVSNSDTKPTSDKDGSAVGLTIGSPKIAALGTWQITYIDRKLGQNSMLAGLGDSDAYGGALNSKGYEAVVTLGLTKNASLGIDYYSMDKINSATATTPKQLVQIDLVYKF